MIDLAATINNFVIKSLTNSESVLVFDEHAYKFFVIYKNEEGTAFNGVELFDNEDYQTVRHAMLSGSDTRTLLTVDELSDIINRGPTMLKSSTVSYLFIHPDPESGFLPQLAISSPLSICVVSMGDKTLDDVSGFVRSDIIDDFAFISE